MPYHLVLDLILRLRKTTGGTENEELDVFVDEGLEIAIGVGTVYYCTFCFWVPGCLGSEFAAKELVHFSGVAVEAESDLDYVVDYGLDAVAAAFDLADDGGHLVAVLRIVNGGEAGDVDYAGHG